MKKLSIVLLAVLLVASLIISCDNSTQALTEELVEVQLGTQAGSRALSSSVTLEQISDPSLKWFYSASKETQQDFATGVTERAFIRLGDTKTFSQGKWTFVLWAEKEAVVDEAGNTTTPGIKVYEGKLEHVLITKSPSPVPVVISVSPYVEGANGTVQFSDVMIQKYSGDSNIIETTAANVITLDGVNVELVNGNAIVNDVTPGSHTVSVSYVANVDGQEVVYASESILITVYSGRTTLIRGNVAEEVGSAEITVIATSAKVTAPEITVTEGKSATTTIEAAVAPSNATAPKADANKVTTVSFPEGALVNTDSTEAGSVSATLSVDTKSIENNIQITDGSTAVAGINISLSVNGSPVTEFNDKYVTITTYIAKNLNNVKVVYNGTGAQPIATDVKGAPDPAIAASLTSDAGTKLGYNSATGLLRFKTNHFSEFNVVANAVCYVSETNTAYSTLDAAFVAATGSRKTVILLKNITGQVTVPSGADVILDLNGKSISTTDATTIINNGTLVLKDSSGEGGVYSSYGNAVGVGDNSTTTIESGTYSGREGAVITGYATGATININGGTFSAADNAVIAGNGSNRVGEANIININGGTFNGGIITTGYVACGIYAPWKDVINVSGGTFIITGGAGIVARAGNVNVSGGTFNCTGSATGKVGDSRVVVPCSALVFDSEANYPALTADSKIKVTGGTFTSEVSIIKVVNAENDTNTRVDFSVSVSDNTQAQSAIMMKVEQPTTTSSSKSINITATNDIVLNLDNAGGYYKATLGDSDTHSVTINANENRITFDSNYRNAINCYGTLTINNATIDSTYKTSGSTWDDYGLIFRYQNGGKNEVVFNNVVFNRQVVIEKGVKATFNNCTINQTSATGDMYALWICAGADVTLNDCTINSKNPNSGSFNRAIKIADEYITGPQSTTLSVSGTTIKSQKKAAVLVTSTAGANITWGEGNNITGVEADSTNAVWNDSDRTNAWDLVIVTGCQKVQEK